MLLGALGRCEWGGGGFRGSEEVSTPDEVDEGKETHDLAKEDTFPSFYPACCLPPDHR